MADTIDKGKKRKRRTDGSSKPSKKVAIEEDRKIKVSLQDGDKWAPVIVAPGTFSLPTSIPFQPYTKPREDAPQRPGKSGSIATEELLLYSSAHPKLNYTAREEDSLQKHYVGVYDPATGKLEIIEARRMEVRGTVRQFQVPEKGAQPTTAGDPRSGVGLAFGTKKSQKALASTTENAIGPSKSERLRADGKSQKFDATTAAVMASMADTTADMATKDELQEQADSSKPRPTANLDATEVRDVYTIDSLIGVEMMKHIPVMDWEQSIKAKKEIIVNSRYVAHRIQSAGSNIEKLKILRYMLLLIDFLNIAKPARGGARALPKRDSMKTAMGGIPEVLVEGVKRKFADGGFIPKFKSDLLITHLCAMACLVDNYEVDMFDLQEDLRLETKDMAQYFREIGAKVGALSEAQRKVLKLEKAAAAQRRVAKLKLPLDFPKVAFGRRAR